MTIKQLKRIPERRKTLKRWGRKYVWTEKYGWVPEDQQENK